MSFLELKENYNKKKDRIKLNKYMKFVGGSGGSKNLIYISKNYVYKVVPYYTKKSYQAKRSNNDQKEIEIYKILTDEFILKNKTPHIVGYYDNYKIKLSSVFDECPSLKEEFLKDNKKLFKDRIDKIKCQLKKDYINKQIKKSADVVVIEKCPDTIQHFLSKIIASNNKNKYKELAQMIDIISFQIIFTLAVIQNRYPSFVHNDFFLRNIMGIIQKYKSNEYNEYKFKNKTFYLPVNGLSVKINDFGLTLAKPNMISTEIFFKSDESNEDRLNCSKCDIFNFFHDFYDGADLGATSVKSMMKRKSEKNRKFIRNIFKKYINVSLIDKMNKANKNKIDWTWYINDIIFLKKIVKTPQQYLYSNIFNKYKKLPKDAVIINKYVY